MANHIKETPERMAEMKRSYEILLKKAPERRRQDVYPDRKHRTTEERLIEFFGEEKAAVILDDCEEIAWGKPEGKEIW
jgi:hypothetical protein